MVDPAEGGDVSEAGVVSYRLQLQMLNLSIFMNHYLLMSSFLVIPIMLKQFGVAIEDHAVYYLCILLGSFVLMLPLVIRWRGSADLLVKILPAIAVMVVGDSLGASIALAIVMWRELVWGSRAR